jgi:hypothetical protein
MKLGGAAHLLHLTKPSSAWWIDGTSKLLVSDAVWTLVVLLLPPERRKPYFCWNALQQSRA